MDKLRVVVQRDIFKEDHHVIEKGHLIMGTCEDREIQAKLRNLKKDFDHNEERMRKAAIDYEDLLAEKETLSAAIEDLKKAKAELRRQGGQMSAMKSGAPART